MATLATNVDPYADPDEPPPKKAVPQPVVVEAESLARARGSLFLVTNRNGDVTPAGARELGLFSHDMRHLSHYELRITDATVVRLSSEATGDSFSQVDLMLSGLTEATLLDDPQNFLHIRRRQALDSGLIEQIVLTNFLIQSVELELSLSFAADFADIFEVRGARRARRGAHLRPQVVNGSLELLYDGLDGVLYRTVVSFSPPPARLSEREAHFHFQVAPGERREIEIRVAASQGRAPRAAPEHWSFDDSAAELAKQGRRAAEQAARHTCDHLTLQRVIEQSSIDVASLQMDVAAHKILCAGIPWFCAPFGRDSLLASYEALLLDPTYAESSLRALAAFQGTKYDDFTEEEPGKIFHELRFGEMVRAGELPHTPYYGTIDATPLFVIVADAVYRVTADLGFLRELRPNILAALAWIDSRSNDGTAFVTYARRSQSGLDNQGWKDSCSGVSSPDGLRGEPPIALCEVQGYCYDAYARGARILAALGDGELAGVYAARAVALREHFEATFWLGDKGRYAFAIDGRGRTLDTVVSNLGHLLWSRIASPARALKTAELLTSPASSSGFGIRTLAAEQPVFNPLSYHNGTVWPHDNALIAKGFSNYGLTSQVAVVFEALVAAMEHFPNHRVPELYCGLSRESGPLVRYPVACSPQAWSAAAPFLLIRAALGLHPDAPRGRLHVRNPQLPPSVKRIEINGLRVGNSRISARFRQVGKQCHVDHLEVTGAPLKTEIELG